MTMVNKEGQKYRCTLPSYPTLLPDQKKDSEAEDIELENLLIPLEGTCLYKTKDWWTYEICYKKSIKQYHVENGITVGNVMVLGVHNPTLDNWEPSDTNYQSQWYTNGSEYVYL